MQERTDKIEGPYVIKNDLLLRGMITVGATVSSGVTLDLRGMVTGDLDVEVGSTAVIHGMVNGIVRNHGGYLEIFGTVDDVVDLSSEARTVIKPGALVNARTL